jgi:hypothetical protein
MQKDRVVSIFPIINSLQYDSKHGKNLFVLSSLDDSKI